MSKATKKQKTLFKFGVAGTGFIAGVIAAALEKSSSCVLAAVSSRKRSAAEVFCNRFRGVPCEKIEELLKTDVDAVYIALPTSMVEECALKCIAAGKHVLADKPFVSYESVCRMVSAAEAKGVLFMDATHFAHNPRTAMIKSEIANRVGEPISLHSCFCWPNPPAEDKIRYNTKLEPMGALGDLGWYSMRAVVEYLQPEGKIVKCHAVHKRDEKTGAVYFVSGVIEWEDGKSTVFENGFNVGTVVMDLSLKGTKGAISLDDFLLDYHSSFNFSGDALGFTYRPEGVQQRKDCEFVAVETDAPQEVKMLDNFAALAVTNSREDREAFGLATMKTQRYLDAIWKAIN